MTRDTRDSNLAGMSERRPETLFLDVYRNQLARGGFVIRVTKLAARICLILVARPGSIISKAEMSELLWGHRKDGGPDSGYKRIEDEWAVARGALSALGYACEREYKRGFMVTPRPWRAAA